MLGEKIEIVELGESQPCIPAQLHNVSSNLLTLAPHASRGRFLGFRGSWASLRPSFWQENLPFTVHRALSKVEILFHDFCAQLFSLKKAGKSWASRIALNSLLTRNQPLVLIYCKDYSVADHFCIYLTIHRSLGENMFHSHPNLSHLF